MQTILFCHRNLLGIISHGPEFAVANALFSLHPYKEADKGGEATNALLSMHVRIALSDECGGSFAQWAHTMHLRYPFSPLTKYMHRVYSCTCTNQTKNVKMSGKQRDKGKRSYHTLNWLFFVSPLCVPCADVVLLQRRF